MDKITISEDIKNKLTKIFNNGFSINDKTLEILNNGDINRQDLYYILEEINHKINIRIDTYLYYINEDLDKEFDKSVKIFNKYKFDNTIDNFEIILNNLDEYLTTSTFIYEVHEKVHLIRDLNNAREDIIKNLKYYKTEEEIEKFNEEYSLAIKNVDIDRMKQLVEQENNNVLNEWKKLDKSIDEMTDDNFCFVGHSAKGSDFEGDFRDTYISCSLYDKDIFDTYNHGYGFIFKPENIVGARNNDMQTNNWANNSNNLLFYTSVIVFEHPKRILEECKELKEQNLKENSDKIVYNELILNKFEPIALFCFTNGSKEYDYNYEGVFELQKSFPNLKIKMIDTLSRKKGIDLENEKLSILNSIYNKIYYENKAKNPNGDYIYSPITKNELFRYQLFFDKLEQLKQTKNYTKDDVKNIYILNNELLTSSTSIEEMIRSNSSIDIIKYKLEKSYTYNIEGILNGNFNMYCLNNLARLLPYKDKLNTYYDGLEEFVILLNKVSLNDELIDKIKKEPNLNLYKISKILSDKLIEKEKEEKLNKQKELNSKEIEIEIQLNNSNSEYNELINKKKEQDEYKKYREICDNNYWTKHIKKDYDELKQDYEANIKKERDLIFSKNTLNKELDSLILRISNISKLNYDDTKEYKTISESISENNNKIILLEKHPFFNRRKISRINAENSNLNNKNNKNRDNFDRKNSDDLNRLEFQLEVLKSSLVQVEIELKEIYEIRDILNNQIENIKKEIKEKFGCDSIDEIDEVVENAKEYIDTHNVIYDYSIDFHIENVRQKIFDLEEKLNEIKSKKNNLIA